jgi:predicted transcriptional regulator
MSKYNVVWVAMTDRNGYDRDTGGVGTGGHGVEPLLPTGINDDVLRALSDRDRRVALWYLGERSTATVAELADVLASGDREAARVELRHRHLPMLASAGLVEYDHEAGRAEATVAPTVRDLLAWLYSHE